jgi:hypothetical protein
MANIMSLPRLDRYVGVSRDEVVGWDTPSGERNFRIILYGALDAYGLIGPEMNGIAILDEDNKSVVLDGECPQASGYYGPSREQLDRWGEIVDFDWLEFKNFVNKHPKSRFKFE